MLTERVQRQVDRLLDEAEEAIGRREWQAVLDKAHDVLDLDPENAEALSLIAAADRALARAAGNGTSAATGPTVTPPRPAALPQPSSFANGRYEVKRFLGEGGKKKVYLAHDSLLDRDVAFALIKTEGLDATARTRILREAQAMGRLGAHPNIVTVFDLGNEGEQPYMVTELMGGGDVEGAIEKAPNHRLPMERTLQIAKEVCHGLQFAHAKGIVHRDLKPGNVWLTGEGRAKIGDFGLAVSMDRSRLTQAGMMVGTVNYMPPEQAVGGETTAQADLYSLGAMLYEMVTGRPPFLGDDPVAIISQHINTPPVAPSWHTEHCPPDLEELILRLLEKDPARRPASATEVLQALGRVDPAVRSASHSGTQENPLDRLARGVFVGRERELERLRTAFNQALSGRGSIVMLVGEPGIGKTRTSQELETFARLRGAQTLWGRAHEVTGVPAYWPWVQVGRAWGSSRAPEQLKAEMGTEARELVRIFPELQQIVPGLGGPEPVSDPDTAQFRLFDAYSAFLRNAGGRAPLLVVLDDLHWADKPTLLLLQHVARELSHMRVLVLGTYRDTELSRTHPLSQTLAELNRGEGFQRIALRGLTRDEIASYIEATARVRPQPGVLERVHEETEGNPFFLSEVVKLMAEEGTLTADSISDVAIPEGVREALGRRLDRLSEEANELLTTAAVIGREFTFDTLGFLGKEEDVLLRLLEEGLRARVIEEDAQGAGRYRFTHALMQETLLAELSTTRRVRMHGQVAEALEKRWGRRAEERAARLAYHYGESATLTGGHAAKAARYMKLAGEQAEAVNAWDEAARHYEACIALVDAGQGDDDLGIDFGAVLLGHGRAMRMANEQRLGWRSTMRAREYYKARNDGVAVARLALEAEQFVAGPDRRTAALEEGLAWLPPGHPELEARLLARRAGIGWQFGRRSPDRARLAEMAARAAALAHEHGLKDVEALLIEADAWRLSVDGRLEEAMARFYDAFEDLDKCGQVALAAEALQQHTANLGGFGRTEQRVQALERSRRYGTRVRHNRMLQSALGPLGQMALRRGELDRARELLAELERLPGNPIVARTLGAGLFETLGEFTEAQARLPEARMAGGLDVWLSNVHGTRARVAYHAGDEPSARRELEIWGRLEHDPGPSLDDALPALGSEDQVRRVYAMYTDPEDSVTVAGGFPLALAKSLNEGWSADRQRAGLALRLDMLDAAERHYREGQEWAEREGMVLEVGRCLQGLSEVAERRGDHAEAMQLLDRAIPLFQKHGAKLYLDRALAKKKILKA